jgi:hypothetical protein
MDEQALRTLIRDAVARHLGPTERTPGIAGTPGTAIHVSHARFNVTTGSDADGPCLIEPAVSCSHCGYCQSHGH